MQYFTADETRVYAPAESADATTEGIPQLTISDTGWTAEERDSMLQNGYDGMDMLRAWLD